MQCKPRNVITLGPRNFDHIKQMITMLYDFQLLIFSKIGHDITVITLSSFIFNKK